MKVALLVSVLLVLVHYLSFAQQNGPFPQQTVNKPPSPINGDYVGVQTDQSLSPEEPAIRWFHENTLVVRNNEVILDKAPFTIQRGKKEYSASDGGFFTYRGRFFQKDGKTFISLRLFQADYVLFVKGSDPYSEVKTYPVAFVSGAILIDGVQYKAKALAKNTSRRLSKYLTQEPLVKSGATSNPE